MKKRIVLIFTLVLVFCYLFTLRGAVDGNLQGKIPGPFESPHERSSFATMMSIIEKSHIQLSDSLAAFGGYDVGTYQHKKFSFFPPGLAIVALPFYLMGRIIGLGQIAAYFMLVSCIFINCWLLYRFQKKYFSLSTPHALISPLVFGLSSTAWSYGITFYQHQLSTLLILISLFLVWNIRLSKIPQWKYTLSLIGIYGLSGFIDYPNFILLLPLIIYGGFLILKKSTLKTSATLILILGMLLGSYPLFNHYVLGNWRIATNTLPRTSRFTNANPEVVHQEALRKASLPNILKISLIPRGLKILFFSIDKGLFIFSPIFIFGFIGLFRKSLYKKPEYYLIVAIVVLNILVYSMFGETDGGWTFGPRFLIPSMSLLSLPLAIFYHFLQSNFYKIMFFIVLWYSQAIALLGALTSNMTPPCYQIPDLSQCTYIKNISFLSKNMSGSFIYNSLLKGHIPLMTCYVILFGIITCTTWLILKNQTKNTS
jgi:hypothetical protein